MNVVTPRIIVVESHEIKKVACIAKREVSSWQELRQKLRAKQLLPETVRLSRGSKRWLGRISLIFKPLTSDTVFRRYVRQLTTMAPKMRNRVTINREIILSKLFCSKDLKKLQAANMTLKLPSDSIFSVFLDVLMWAQPILLLIRPLLEYGCIVWHFSLPLCLSDRLESVQKRALRLILPHYSYASALETLNLPSLLLRREPLCSKSFSKLTSLANPRFLRLLPAQRRDANDSATSLRNSSNFTLPAVRTERFKRSFIPSMLFSQ